MKYKDKLIELFDLHAENYSDYTNNYTVKRRYQAISKYLNGSILEIGASNGEILKLIDKTKVNDFLLTDISNEMCKFIEKKYNHKALCVDVENLKLNEKEYNSIIALDVLCYVNDLDRAIKNILNHLTEDGCILISTFNPKLKFIIKLRFFINKYTNLKHLWFDDPIPAKFEYLDVDNFLSVLKRNNLYVSKTYYLAPFPFKALHFINVVLEKTIIKKLSTNFIYEIKRINF